MIRSGEPSNLSFMDRESADERPEQLIGIEGSPEGGLKRNKTDS